MKKHNFSAGPSLLPKSVCEKAAQAVVEYNNSGLSLLEMSHRGNEFLNILQQARETALRLANLNGKGYQCLFLQGGASMQFLMVAYNLLNQQAGYLDTGTWANKALQEASKIGKVKVIATSKEAGYKHIPKNITIPTDIDYLHLTTNNTIYGTQYHFLPETQVPMVADMSSDIFSRAFPYEKFGLIYAGAQKNLGTAGTTMVLVREDLLGRISRNIPTLLDYQVHIKNESMSNTPPTFAIYVSLLTMQWIEEVGGVGEIEKRNTQKAQLLYEEIDRNPLFIGYATTEDRSQMNAVFNLADEKLTERFQNLCLQAGVCNLKGHRTLGGYRASIYNAMPIESVQVLVDVMQELTRIS